MATALHFLIPKMTKAFFICRGSKHASKTFRSPANLFCQSQERLSCEGALK